MENFAIMVNIDLLSDVPRGTSDMIKRYIELMIRWNAHINLFSRELPIDSLLKAHVQDAIIGAKFIEKEVLDVASGNGIPGIIYAIMRPDILVHLCDVDKRKVAFLRHVIVQLNLANVILHECDYRDIIAQFSIVSVKAFIIDSAYVSNVKRLIIYYNQDHHYHKLLVKFSLNKYTNPSYNNRHIGVFELNA